MGGASGLSGIVLTPLTGGREPEPYTSIRPPAPAPLGGRKSGVRCRPPPPVKSWPLTPDPRSAVPPPSDPPLSVTVLALLGQLWEECRPRLLAMLRRRIDPALAVRIDPEELLSESFIYASRQWKWFRGQEALSGYAWLYRVAFDRLIE